MKTLWLAKASTDPKLDKLKIRPLDLKEVEKIRREVEAMPSPFVPNVKTKFLPGAKVERVIDSLRRVHGGTWKFEPRGHTYLQTSTGRRVYWSAPPMDDGWEDAPGAPSLGRHSRTRLALVSVKLGVGLVSSSETSMGADGGYYYIPEKLVRDKCGADFDLFVQFVGHAFGHDVREELLDVAQYEREYVKGPHLRLPYGTDFHPEIARRDFNLSDRTWFAASDAEVWYYFEFAEENDRGFYWWDDPRTWWKFEDQKFVLPTLEELDRLLKVVERIGEIRSIHSVETWT